MNRRNVLQAAGALAVASVIPKAFAREEPGITLATAPDGYPIVEWPFESSSFVPAAQPYKTLGICPYDLILPVTHEDINPVHEEFFMDPNPIAVKRAMEGVDAALAGNSESVYMAACQTLLEAQQPRPAIRVLSTLDDRFKKHVARASELGLARGGYVLDTSRDVQVEFNAEGSTGTNRRLWGYYPTIGTPGDPMWVRNQVHYFNAPAAFDPNSKWCSLYMALVTRRGREYDRRHPESRLVTADGIVRYNIDSDEHDEIDSDLSYLRIRFFLKRKGLDENAAVAETSRVYGDAAILKMGIAPWVSYFDGPYGWGSKDA